MKKERGEKEGKEEKKGSKDRPTIMLKAGLITRS